MFPQTGSTTKFSTAVLLATLHIYFQEFPFLLGQPSPGSRKVGPVRGELPRLTRTRPTVKLPTYNESQRDCKENSFNCKHGRCLEDRQGQVVCICMQGWRGQFCDELINATTGPHPPTFEDAVLKHLVCLRNETWCENGGSCVVDRLQLYGYRCVCRAGYGGQNCSTRCTVGQWGPNCKEKCSGCSGLACHPAHGCLACERGWTGLPHCADLDCMNAPCENSGECVEEDQQGTLLKCFCLPGYTGARCETQIFLQDWFDQGFTKCDATDKRLLSCVHGGLCVYTELALDPASTPISPRCFCPEGRLGRRCERRCECGHGDCSVTTLYDQTKPSIECMCWPGYQYNMRQRRCNVPCSLYTWGDCRQPCGSCFNLKPCNHVTGLCLNNRCLSTHFGVRCEHLREQFGFLERHRVAMVLTLVDEDGMTSANITVVELEREEKLIQDLRLFVDRCFEADHRSPLVGIERVIVAEDVFYPDQFRTRRRMLKNTELRSKGLPLKRRKQKKGGKHRSNWQSRSRAQLQSTGLALKRRGYSARQKNWGYKPRQHVIKTRSSKVKTRYFRMSFTVQLALQNLNASRGRGRKYVADIIQKNTHLFSSPGLAIIPTSVQSSREGVTRLQSGQSGPERGRSSERRVGQVVPLQVFGIMTTLVLTACAAVWFYLYKFKYRPRWFANTESGHVQSYKSSPRISVTHHRKVPNQPVKNNSSPK